jgi:hypothetical protein
MIVELVLIDDLTLDPKNARRHDDKNLRAIAESLKQFGQRKPIVVWGRTVVAGNGTLVAARSLGWKEIQVARVPDDWSVDKVTAYALADNRSAELAVWDDQVLTEQLKELELADWDVEALGFEATVEPLQDIVEDDIPELYEAKAKLGQVWQLGRHRVMCGDATDSASRAKLIAGSTIDAVVTDPPYGIGAGNWKKLGKGKTNTNAGNWDNAVPEISFLLDLAPIQIIWGGNYFTDVLPPTNDWLCWHKKNDGRTFSEFELAWTNLGKQARLLSHHWSGEAKEHITMKPSPVMDWCLEFLPDTCTVLDVFAGSGSTLLAAERSNKTCFALELSPKYVDVIIARWEKLTGLTAELVEG